MLDSFKNLVGKKTKEETQLKTYKNILEKNPNNVNIRLKLGDLYAKMGEKQAAIHEYTTAAVQYADDGYLVKAIAVNKIIVRLDPSRKEALDRLSELYFQRGVTADPIVEQYRKERQQTQAPEPHPKQAAPAPSKEEPELEPPPEPVSPPEEEHELDFTVESHDHVSLAEEPERQPVALDSARLQQIPLLASLSDEDRHWLLTQSTVHTVNAQEPILRQEDIQAALYIVLEGQVKLLTKDREQCDTLLAKIEPNNFFGEMTLFAPETPEHDNPYQHDLFAIADTSCTILELSKPTLTALLKKAPRMSDLIKKYYTQRASDITLARVPIFSHLDPDERREIVDHLSPMSIPKGTTIITEGEIGDSMYVIKTGKVGVYT
ncbi:cyclic nucleotide-binding domain-containing protein, partial [candidate division KSB3 bacterium]|nr:cyclic nucleotide-binding domain-containing protein [candidate division KSB3 bacterium]MBD3327429.1 cyclic nucleotide-binding domain-containing protein [candidate division KSB3 bacterium]